MLAVISSDWFFDEVIRHSELSRARTYRQAGVANKETTTLGWVRLLRPPAGRHPRLRPPRSSQN
ncbi:hypothetical protein SAMN05216188_10956 [Lentzea xinjiangensis]|uniref:Uncharacterized protein n=1 Tax=Lentzea xinjiangensis TaxID=402600 RepID=A0A1H9MHK3_9PSEU|nr:hypothetical protein [Lentzea xinjiangensis]SER22905.1 hypothetical protein SAMN05216188_10956 [Lentzea xinjiangensis]